MTVKWCLTSELEPSLCAGDRHSESPTNGAIVSNDCRCCSKIFANHPFPTNIAHTTAIAGPVNLQLVRTLEFKALDWYSVLSSSFPLNVVVLLQPLGRILGFSLRIENWMDTKENIKISVHLEMANAPLPNILKNRTIFERWGSFNSERLKRSADR